MVLSFKFKYKAKVSNKSRNQMNHVEKMSASKVYVFLKAGFPFFANSHWKIPEKFSVKKLINQTCQSSNAGDVQ